MEPTVYTHGHADAVLRSHRSRTAGNSAAYLLPSLRPGMSLLDVGCGPGTLTADLAAVVAPGRVVGVDAAGPVLEEARAHAAAVGVDVEVVECDLFGFDPGPGGRFDVVHAHQVLQHLADPVAGLRVMAGLARPGGVVAARDADYGAMTWWPPDPRLDRWLDVYHAVTRRNGAEADAGRRLLAWAVEAGLSDVRYTTSTWTYATADDRAWWGGLWAERVVASRFAEQAVGYGIASAEELAELAAAWQAWAAAPDGVFVIVHGEVVATA